MKKKNRKEISYGERKENIVDRENKVKVFGTKSPELYRKNGADRPYGEKKENVKRIIDIFEKKTKENNIDARSPSLKSKRKKNVDILRKTGTPTIRKKIASPMIKEKKRLSKNSTEAIINQDLMCSKKIVRTPQRTLWDIWGQEKS